MRDWFRLLRMLRSYRRQSAMLVVSILLASVLSTVGITFISPLLRILFLEQPTPPAVEMVRSPQESVAPTQSEASKPSSPQGPGTAIPVPEKLSKARHNIQTWVESHLYKGDRSAMVLRVSILLFLLYLAKNLFTFAQGAFTAILEQKVIYDIRQNLFMAIQDMPLRYFSQERTGYLMSRVIIDVDMMRGALVGCASQILSNSIMVVLALVLVLWWSWQLSLATLIIVPPNILLMGYLSKKMRKGSHRTQESMGALATVLQETIAGIRIVKAFTMERAERLRYGKENRRYYKAYTKMKVLEALSSPVSEILGITTAVVILAFGGHLVLSGRLRPDLLVAFLGVMLWVIGPIKNLIKVNSTLQQSLAAARRVFLILDAEKEEANEGGIRTVDGLRERIVFEQVSFDYRDDVAVLRDISLTIPAGTTLGIVGPSGAGKSTLVDLIPRFYHPTSGRITLDGIDLEDIYLPTLRSMVGVVTQEVILFNDTIAANISYGSPNASREKIIEAARTANAHDFISDFPEGYDTTVGERGTQLSGGQRQRIAIARAILRDPPILIFDEATSSLDTESEKLVQEAIERLVKGRTTIVIAHRLSTLVRADRIVVLQDGRIVEEGVHETLLARKGVYRRLYELQDSGRPPEPGPSPELAG
jgi:subfamily B ATP-binding cassette protein MsbA